MKNENKNHSRSCGPQDSGISTLENNETPDKSIRRWTKKVCHAEKLLLSISRLQGRCCLITTTNNGTKGGPELQLFRTTTCFNHAFTLIELLVVVLIIGILAAIAVPQYEKAVVKSQSAQALVLLKSLYQAQEAYYLANGEYALSFQDLGFSLPWTGNTPWYMETSKNAISNEKWSLEIARGGLNIGTMLGIVMLTGKYKGAGFAIYLNPTTTDLQHGVLYCGECVGESACPNNRFDKTEGDFCKKILQIRNTSYNGAFRAYKVP